MARRRITVAFQQVETTPMRQFRLAATGAEWSRRRMPVLRDRHEELREDGEALGSYWCAADRPRTSDTALGLMVKPIYPGTVVPQEARCEVCGIGIRELQAEMRGLQERLRG